MLSEEAREKIRIVALRYPVRRGALLPALQIVQSELGRLSDEAIQFVAAELEVSDADAYGTATFYSLLTHGISGGHVISICHNLTCTLLGAEPLIAYLEKKLAIGEGEVTSDGKFSFRRIECIGRCDGAPAMLVDDDYYGNLTQEKIDAILERYP